MKSTLEKYLNKENGKYIELGAFDGEFQSNTKWLEDELGWTGILIEPSPSQYQKCLETRPNNNIFNCACVSFEYTEGEIKGDFIGKPGSSVAGMRRGNAPSITVDAHTLQDLIDKTEHDFIDFLSLDVEGYELDVLKGVDFTRQIIDYILIEVYSRDKDILFSFMEDKGYTTIGNISNFTKETHPNWDGTHNDYLFKRK